MITELKLSNFRLFDEEVTVRFRPITVLIGRNNSGKSSIIKFLLMLKQSLNRESALFLNPQGGKTDLGRFEELKNTLTEKKDLWFQLTVTEENSLGDALMSYVKSKGSNQSMGEVAKKLHFVSVATIPYQTTGKSIKKHEVILYHGEQEWLVRNKYINDHCHFLDFTPEWNQEKNRLSDSLNKQKKQSQQKDPSKELLQIEHQHNAEQQIVHTLKSNLNNLYHLLPIRKLGKDSIVSGSAPLVTVGKDGRYTLPHLKAICDNEYRKNHDFILPHIQKVAGIKEINFETKEFISYCFGVNQLTGAEVLIDYFGFGVSQCLPIFVQGALMPQYSALMVEQPEAQLHPTAQLELGEFFADLWTERKVASVIETHSDNILLRLRRLIAKGDLKPEDVSVAFFDFDEDKKQAIIKNLDIAEDGTMQEGLPWEFFGKHVKEIVKMGDGE